MRHPDFDSPPAPQYIKQVISNDTTIYQETTKIIYRDTAKYETKYVFFKNNNAELKEGGKYYVAAMAELYDVGDKMKRDSSLIVRIKAWESPTSELDDSKNLSTLRAKIVKAKFVSMGIDPSRIFFEPNGKDLDSKNALEMGRRVGFTLGKK